MKKDPFGRREAPSAGKPAVRPVAQPKPKPKSTLTRPSIVRKDVGPSSLWEVIKRLFR